MNKVLNIIYVSVSLFISAVLFNVFFLPSNVVVGGINGISIILNNLYNFDPSISIFILSLISVILSLIFLGLKQTIITIIMTIIYPIFIKLTFPFVVFFYEFDDLLLISIYVGIISGFSNGLMYRTGYTGIGIPTIVEILHRKLKLSHGKLSFFINSIIIIFASIKFGIPKSMYAIIILFFNSKVIDKMVFRKSEKKMFSVISKDNKNIDKFIQEKLNTTSTTIKVSGGYLNGEQDLTITIIPTKYYYHLKDKMINKKSFILVNDVYSSSK